jgi:hypothetical protein
VPRPICWDTISSSTAWVPKTRLQVTSAPAGRLEVATQQVDVSARLVHHPAAGVGRPSGQRADQGRGLVGAPQGQQRLNGVGGQQAALK